MNRNLILVAAAMCAWGFGEGTFLYFNPIYMEQLGADSIAIGAILGGFGLAMTISHVPAGLLADRFGRKPLMIAAWVLGLAATWIMALAESLPFFVAGLLVYGVTLFVISPLFSYVTAARRSLHRPRHHADLGQLQPGRPVRSLPRRFDRRPPRLAPDLLPGGLGICLLHNRDLAGQTATGRTN